MGILWLAKRQLSTPVTQAAAGPGLLSTPARRSSSAKTTTLGDRRLRGAKIRESPPATNNSRRSTVLSSDDDTVIDALQSCVTVVDSSIDRAGREQSPRNNTANDNMASRSPTELASSDKNNRTVPAKQKAIECVQSVHGFSRWLL